MKDKLRKVKRPWIDWNELRLHLEDQLLDGLFWRIKSRNLNISDNRVSYLAFTSLYGKQACKYYRWTGDITIFLDIQGVTC